MSPGLDYQVLFCQRGYTPHYAEHVVDPLDGREKLVMADPHTRRAALVYDMASGCLDWACPRPDGTGAWLLAPHSAFRLGRIECRGNLTVVGSEAGGSIMALDYFGRPAWAVTGGVAFRDSEGLHYTVGPEGLGEITHVFPTLDGRIGFCSWLGLNCSVVGALRRPPSKQEAHFTLAHELEISGGLRYLGPPIKAEGWEELLIIVECEGPGPVRWRVEGIGRPLLDLRGPAPPAVLITSATARPGEASSAYIREPYKWLRLAVEPVGARARISAHVLLRRG